MATVVEGGLRRWAPDSPELVLRFIAGMLVLVLNAADVVTTNLMVGHGGREMNPVAGWFLDNGSLAVAKMAVAGAVAVFLVLAPPRSWIPRAVAVVTGAYVGVVTAHLIQLGGV